VPSSRASRALGRAFVLLSAAALLSACRVDTTVDIGVAADGTGQVRVSAGFDDEAMARVGDLRLDDARAAGWAVTGPQKEPERDTTGRTWIHASKNFRTPDELSAIMREINGPNGMFRDFQLQRTTGFGKVTYTVTGTIDPSKGLEAFSDPEVAQLLGGNAFGRPTAELANDAKNLSMVFGIVLPDDLEGAADRSEGRRGEWDVVLGDAPTTIAVRSTDSRGAARLWTAGAALLAIGAVACAVFAIVSRSRTRRRGGRPRRDRVPAGVIAAPPVVRSPVASPAPAPPRNVAPLPAPRVEPSAPAERAAAPSRKRIQVVVLDAMGVLYREADDVESILIPFVREHGGVDDPLAIRGRYGDASLGRHTTRELWSLLGVAGDAAQLDRDYVERFELSAGVHEFLDAMDQRDIAVAGLTNDVAEWSTLARARFGLDRRIDPWIVSGEVGARKPDDPIFVALAQALGVPLRACLLVDDRADNLAAGKAHGMATVQFAPEPIEGSPFRRVGSLFELFNRGRVAT
jgi:putative hydrolase of the HAD superfamily